MSFYVSGYVADEMLEPFNFLAKHMKRSKSFLVGDALRQYIAEKMEEFDDEIEAEKALQRMNSASRTFCSSEDMTKFIDENCHDS